MQKVNFDAFKEKQDYVSSLKDKANQLKMDYMTATGQEWGGAPEYDMLQGLFNQYNQLTYQG